MRSAFTMVFPVIAGLTVFSILMSVSVHPVHGGMEIRDGDFYLDGERYIARAVEVVSSWPPERETIGMMMDQMLAAGVNAIRVHSGYNHAVFEEALARDIYMVVGFPCYWDNHCTLEEALEIVEEYSAYENILAWCIGNELYTEEITVPIDYIRELNDFTHENDPHGRWTTYANHMVMNCPDVALNPVLYLLGFRPVDFVDVIAWNAYPILRALSWDDLVVMWWEDNREEVEGNAPILAMMIDRALELYSDWAGDLPDEALQSAAGLGYLMLQYARNAYFQNWSWGDWRFHHKPWILTEWAAIDDPVAVENDFRVISFFEEVGSLDGYVYFKWSMVDHGHDGIIDNTELYETIARLYGGNQP